MKNFLITCFTINLILSVIVSLFFTSRGDKFWRLFFISLVLSWFYGITSGIKQDGERNRKKSVKKSFA